MRRGSVPWLLVVVAATAMVVFVALTVVVTASPSLALDSRAFQIADDLRAPWLDDAARVVTTLGLIAIVGSAVLLGAALVIKRRHRARAASLVVGAALAWISVWTIKSVVDRARPLEPLVHTSGQSYPSAHAANAVGWLALAIALTVAIPTRGGRTATITAGALLATLVGLSRIYCAPTTPPTSSPAKRSPWRCTRSPRSARSRRNHAATQPSAARRPPPSQPASRELRPRDLRCVLAASPVHRLSEDASARRPHARIARKQ